MGKTIVIFLNGESHISYYRGHVKQFCKQEKIWINYTSKNHIVTKDMKIIFLDVNTFHKERFKQKYVGKDNVLFMEHFSYKKTDILLLTDLGVKEEDICEFNKDFLFEMIANKSSQQYYVADLFNFKLVPISIYD